MLDRILYLLASPLAREIIDSLRNEPGEWMLDGTGMSHCDDTYEKPFWLSSTGLAYQWRFRGTKFSRGWDRLTLRRAVNQWRKAHD